MLNKLVNELVEIIQESVFMRGKCHLVFPGGRTQRGIFELLCKQDLPWSVLHLYPSDERCVEIGSQERNDQLIKELLFSHTSFPEENLHSIPAELGPDEGARYYSEFLETIPQFDIVILSAGEDGHIASLFPNDQNLEDKHVAVPVYDAPKWPSERVSIGLQRLKTARERWVIIIGIEKRWLIGQLYDNNHLPMNLVLPTKICVD